MDFLDHQFAFNRAAVDGLLTEWLYNAVAQMHALVPLSETGDSADTLSYRFENGLLTSRDATLLPFFKRVSMTMAAQMSCAMQTAAEQYLAFWQQYDVRRVPAHLLVGYPTAVKVCHATLVFPSTLSSAPG